MKLIKFFILTVLLLSFSDASAQVTTMLWGYSDNPKREDTFTFVFTLNGAPVSIIFTSGSITSGISIETFKITSLQPVVYTNENDGVSTIEISDDAKTAILRLPDRTTICYRLVVPPAWAIQNGQSNGGYNGGYNDNNSSTGESHVVYVECSLCHGKGWIAGNKTPVYSSGEPYYCPDCHREVPPSHSHDRCPGCQGTGRTPHVR